MCLGPKCPCIYPKRRHIQSDFISFRERSPIDRSLLKSRLSRVSQSLLSRLRYQIRPAVSLQYSCFALAQLLGYGTMSWESIQPLFLNYEKLIERVSQIDVGQLSDEQIQNAQYWMEQFDKVSDGSKHMVFANAVQQILSKVEIYRKGCERSVCDSVVDDNSNTTEEVSQLKITQEMSPQSHIFSDILQTTDKKIYSIDTSRSANKTNKVNNHTSRINYFKQDTPKQDDIISLKKELQLLEKEIRQQRSIKNSQQYLQDRKYRQIAQQQMKEQNMAEYKMKNRNSNTPTLTQDNNKSIYEFRRQLMSNKNVEVNKSYDNYIKRYCGKYLLDIDGQECAKQELLSVKSQISIAQRIKSEQQ